MARSVKRSRELSTVQVTRQGVPVANINELEYIDGSVWANVWFSDEIIQIDPSSGNVTDAINFAAIYPKRLRDKELTSLGTQTLQHYTYMHRRKSACVLIRHVHHLPFQICCMIIKLTHILSRVCMHKMVLHRHS
jgi:glutamine cyclotransferase